VERLSVYSLLTGLADLIGSVWTSFNSVTNGIMGFAGFEESNDDEERPTWVTFLVIGVLVLVIFAFYWTAAHRAQ
jgi:hypothetical protein